MTPATYIDKAQRALEGARVLLDAGNTEGACSRAYYAMHDAAHAALIATGHETPDAIIKTHHTMIAEFGKQLVRSGRIDAAFGRALNRVQNMRLLADYSAEPPALDDARWAVEKAAAFITEVRAKFLKRHRT